MYSYGVGSETIDTGTILKVIEGKDSIAITCSDADGNPSPSYSWSGLHTSQTGVLQIFNISRNDSGIYICHAQNTLVRTVGAARSEYFNRSQTIHVLCKLSSYFQQVKLSRFRVIRVLKIILIVLISTNIRVVKIFMIFSVHQSVNLWKFHI